MVENPVPPGVTGDLWLETLNYHREGDTFTFLKQWSLAMCDIFAGCGSKLAILSMHITLYSFQSAQNTVVSASSPPGCWNSGVLGNRMMWVRVLAFLLTV